MTQTLDHVVARWARLGAAFNTRPSGGGVDLELLLLETARCASQDERVFAIVATWLCNYGDLVAKHRLKRLVIDELEDQYEPVLGLLLDTVRQQTRTTHFNDVISECHPAIQSAPLFEIERKHRNLARLAERHASPVSRHWNLWARPLHPRDDALRPTRWILKNNPGYQTRADFKGDLRASILAALQHEPEAGESEASLARSCGATRSAIRSSLRSLERAGRVNREYRGKRHKTLLAITVNDSGSRQNHPR